VQFAIGFKIQGKTGHVVVDTEDALIAGPTAAHPIEQIGAKLRAIMRWIKERALRQRGLGA
jgi:hypothetical protein